MSRIGKKPIEIPENVEIKIEDGVVGVKGPLGELSRRFNDVIDIKLSENSVILNPRKDFKGALALWGTYASHIKNMLDGVTKGFEKKLVVQGIGYKARLDGKNLVLNLGFSHPVSIKIPEHIKVSIEKDIISIFGADKETVGGFSANVRSLKKPEPYKGKGIRYENEAVRRKAGKKAVAAA